MASDPSDLAPIFDVPRLDDIMAIMSLASQGLLSLDGPVSKFLPSFRGAIMTRNAWGRNADKYNPRFLAEIVAGIAEA